MPLHHHVEEPADRGQVQLAGRLRGRLAIGSVQCSNVVADAARRDAGQLEVPVLAPEQEPVYGVPIRLAGIIVADLVAEEFGVGEPGVDAGLGDNCRRLGRGERCRDRRVGMWDDVVVTQATSVPRWVAEPLTRPLLVNYGCITSFVYRNQV